MRKVEWAFAWVCLVALGSSLLGCGGAEEKPAGGGAPRRIVALAPSVAESLYFLGLGDRVVGVGDYVQWPPSWADKPRLGGLFDPQLERIVGLRPDLAILLPSEERLRAQLEALEIEVLTVPSETLHDVEQAITAIGERCRVTAAAEAFIERWRQQLSPRPLPRSITGVLIVGREPGRLGGIVVAGRETFLHELASRMGVRNVFGQLEGSYPQVGIEEILAAQPQVVIELQPLAVTETRVAALRADWRRLPGLDASETDCVQVLAGDHVLIPGPRLPDLFGELRELVLRCVSPPALDSESPPAETDESG